MTYPRLLIPFANTFLVRYLLHTGMLKSLSGFSIPVILLRWENSALAHELVEAGAQVEVLPEFRYDGEFERLRHRLVYARKAQRQLATTRIEKRMHLARLGWGSKIHRIIRDSWINIELGRPGAMEQLEEQEKQAFVKNTNSGVFEKLLKELSPDALFSVTPFLIDEEPLLRVARQNRLPLFTSILSFDNLTTKDPLPVPFDLYCVWNKHNADEILKFYPSASKEKIVITGPPQFDFYWKRDLFLSRDEWLEGTHISSGRKILLFGAGPDWIAPNEPHWLSQILNAIDSGEISGSPIVLFRKHPLDTYERWGNLLKSRNIFIDKSWNARDGAADNLFSLEDAKLFIATLRYTDCHISAASTLSIDGSIFDKPQACPAYDDHFLRSYDYISRQTYYREHYLPITLSGALSVAHSRKQLVNAINQAISDPAMLSLARQKMVDEICTYTDGRSTQRVVQAVARQLGVSYP